MIGSDFGDFASPFGQAGGSSPGPPSGERTLVVSEALTASVGNRLLQNLAVLDEPAGAPVQILMSSAPGGDEQAALSVHDAVHAAEAPVTMIGGGRIAGAGIYAFLGADASRRVGLPHVRFCFEPPTAPAHSDALDLSAQAEESEEHRARVRALVAAATGQSEEQIRTDLSDHRTFDAEAAVAYGLIDRVVQSRRELD